MNNLKRLNNYPLLAFHFFWRQYAQINGGSATADVLGQEELPRGMLIQLLTWFRLWSPKWKTFSVWERLGYVTVLILLSILSTMGTSCTILWSQNWRHSPLSGTRRWHCRVSTQMYDICAMASYRIPLCPFQWITHNLSFKVTCH